jgi:hypothetical protein
MQKNGIAGAEYIMMQDKIAVTKIAKNKVEGDDLANK